MGKLKNMALVNAPLAVRKSSLPSFNTPPSRFTYALPAFTAELRPNGWYVARSVPTFSGDKPAWSGPFETIDAASQAIARTLAGEIVVRHQRMVAAHKIAADDPLYGLKTATPPRQAKKTKAST